MFSLSFEGEAGALPALEENMRAGFRLDDEGLQVEEMVDCSGG
jgi:hypothetical protein